MNPSSLPPELFELENRLLARKPLEPDAQLRRRVMKAIGDELAGGFRWTHWWWAAVAAAVLIVMNLGVAGDSLLEFSHGPAHSTSFVQDLQQIDTLQQGVLR